MSNNKRYRRKKGYKKNRRQKGSANATASLIEEVRIEYSELPNDLSAEEIEALVDGIEKAKPKRKPKAMSHTDLQALPHFELHEIAEAEKLDLPANITRRELIFRISEGRLNRHIPVTVSGCLEIGEKGHAFLRLSLIHI